MVAGWGTCPRCGLAPIKKNGRDRRGTQVYRCRRYGASGAGSEWEHSFARNLAGGHYRLGEASDPTTPQPPLQMRAWEELTELLLAG